MADTEVWTPAQYRQYLAGGVPPASAAPLPPSPPPPADRYRSKTERRYAETVLAPAVAAGEVQRWWYEPQKGLYLGPETSYTPDFLLWYADGRPLEFHEVKGKHIYEKDWIKAKQAAALYACYVFRLAQWKDGRWWYKLIPSV